jgi:multidrug efflux pump subunit AcrA (membrane-fusion protein)
VQRALAVAAAACLVVACSGDGAPTVEVEPVGDGEVTQTISAPATVQAADRQPVTATTPGVVARIVVADGDRVDAGDVVVELANDEVDLALEQAQAAEAALTASQSGVQVDPPGDAAIAASHESVADLDADVRPDLAKARSKVAQIDDPQQRAAARKTVALLADAYHDLRDALLDAGQAAAQQQNAVAASFAGVLDQALAQATAGQASQAANAADTAAARADDLVLTAPFDGVVQLGRSSGGGAATLPEGLAGAGGDAAAGALADGLGGAAGGQAEGGPLRVGSPVSPGQTVFTVFDLSQLYVRADVDEIDAPALAEGQPAEVLLDAFPDRTFSGEVTAVALEAETSATGGVAYPVRVQLAAVPRRRSRRPRLGMTASVEIITDTVTSDRVVPARAVVRRGGGQAVFVVRDGVAVLVPVEVEALGEERAAVGAPGLRSDDQVIVSGYEDLSDGDAVSTGD